jgi:hypothetical protein
LSSCPEKAHSDRPCRVPSGSLRLFPFPVISPPNTAPALRLRTTAATETATPNRVISGRAMSRSSLRPRSVSPLATGTNRRPRLGRRAGGTPPKLPPPPPWGASCTHAHGLSRGPLRERWCHGAPNMTSSSGPPGRDRPRAPTAASVPFVPVGQLLPSLSAPAPAPGRPARSRRPTHVKGQRDFLLGVPGRPRTGDRPAGGLSGYCEPVERADCGSRALESVRGRESRRSRRATGIRP